MEISSDIRVAFVYCSVIDRRRWRSRLRKLPGSSCSKLSTSLKFQTLISILPKNQAAPIEMVISDFFRILKTFIAFVSLCHKSPKAKGKL